MDGKSKMKSNGCPCIIRPTQEYRRMVSFTPLGVWPQCPRSVRLEGTQVGPRYIAVLSWTEYRYVFRSPCSAYCKRNWSREHSSASMVGNKRINGINHSNTRTLSTARGQKNNVFELRAENQLLLSSSFPDHNLKSSFCDSTEFSYTKDYVHLTPSFCRPQLC